MFNQINSMLDKYIYWAVLLHLFAYTVCLEPISMSLAIAGAAALGYNMETILCKYKECCNDQYIPENIKSDYLLKISLINKFINLSIKSIQNLEMI